jgi:hypothetical protein
MFSSACLTNLSLFIPEFVYFFLQRLGSFSVVLRCRYLAANDENDYNQKPDWYEH